MSLKGQWVRKHVFPMLLLGTGQGLLYNISKILGKPFNPFESQFLHMRNRDAIIYTHACILPIVRIKSIRIKGPGRDGVEGNEVGAIFKTR